VRENSGLEKFISKSEAQKKAMEND